MVEAAAMKAAAALAGVASYPIQRHHLSPKRIIQVRCLGDLEI
jgi:hypothetical protein